NDRARTSAYFALERALQMNPNRQDVRRTVARVATGLGLFHHAKVHLKELAKGGTDDAELLRLEARCEAGLHEFEKAADLYDKAIRKEPGHTETALEYALLLRQQQDPASADQVIEVMVELGGQLPAVRAAAARYYRNHGDLKKAREHVG